MITHYGQTAAELVATESTVAREIVKELTSHIAVSQRQILLIIHGLAMNLENNDEMMQITELIRSLRGDLFLIDRADNTSTTASGGHDGTFGS